MVAEIVSVGTEILLGQIADTNAQLLGTVLPEYGISHLHRQTVGDNLSRLEQALRLALSRSDLVFTIGGLGPTGDDLTRDGVAAALEDEMVYDPVVEEKLRKMFALRNLPWVDSQCRQAFRPASASLIDNPNGTAPGLHCEKGGKHVILMPGPRGEFGPMLQGPVREILQHLAGDEVIVSRILKVCGLGESIVEDRVRRLLANPNPSVAPYAKLGEVHLRVTAKAANREEAEALLAPTIAAIKAELGDAVFGEGEDTLESSIVALLKERGKTVAVAESITGGGVGARLTSIPGASAVVRGGVIAYQSEVKQKLLNVDDAAAKDPVSAHCAEQMAQGARAALNADFAVSLTGNAGPDVDAGGKPVGLVYVCVASPSRTTTEEYRYRATRADIRRRAEQAALNLLRNEILATS